MSDDEICDLCGLDVAVSGFGLKTQQGDKHFCCEGCMGIYQMLHEDDIVGDLGEKEKGNGVNYG